MTGKPGLVREGWLPCPPAIYSSSKVQLDKEYQMAQHISLRAFRWLGTVLIAAFVFTLFASEADARRARNAVIGGTIGAGVGALVDGSSGARTGAAAGALIGAVKR